MSQCRTRRARPHLASQDHVSIGTPYSPFHMSSFTLAVLPLNVAAPPSPSSTTRSLSCPWRRFSKISITLDTAFLRHCCCAGLSLPSLPLYPFPPSTRLACRVLDLYLLFRTCVYKPPRLASSIAGNCGPPFSSLLRLRVFVLARLLDDKPSYRVVVRLPGLVLSLAIVSQVSYAHDGFTSRVLELSGPRHHVHSLPTPV